jgi:HEAT repeats
MFFATASMANRHGAAEKVSVPRDIDPAEPHMQLTRFLLITIILAGLVSPASAGLFFNRKAKSAPDRVPTLIGALKTDPEERHRADAARQLRDFDVTAYPEILPALIEAAQSDAKAGVRLDALQSLARVRPVSQQAGQTLESLADHDSSLRVRVQARSALIQYRLSGYHASRNVQKQQIGPTIEPPLAPTLEPAGLQAPSPSPAPNTYEPYRSMTPMPIQVNPKPGPLVPVPAPRLEPAPMPTGPDLGPPS